MPFVTVNLHFQVDLFFNNLEGQVLSVSLCLSISYTCMVCACVFLSRENHLEGKTHPECEYHQELGSGMNKKGRKRKTSWERTISHLSLLPDVGCHVTGCLMFLLSCICYYDWLFPLEIWAKINPFFPKMNLLGNMPHKSGKID